MFKVKVHQHIERIIFVFYRVGVWHRQDEATAGEIGLKIFYSFYNALWVLSMLAGTLETANIDELIFSIEFTLIVTVALIKLLYLIWRKKEILELLESLCCYPVQDENIFGQVNDKLNNFMNFVVAYLISICISSICVSFVIPFLGISERQLFFNIGFPLDWKNDDFAYWVAFTFSFTQVNIVVITIFFSTFIWYLMTNCSLMYRVLGQHIQALGKVRSFERIGIVNVRKPSRTEQDKLFLRHLLECIVSHNYLIKFTNELDSFFSKLFGAQLATSALCICFSICSIAFSTKEMSVKFIIYIMTLVFNLFEIFMIMSFGNEIELASDRLSYCLFESDWTDRPESTKKIVLIFGELLMNRHQLIILKLYPLNLDTFSRILNSAYSTFNILQNFK